MEATYDEKTHKLVFNTDKFSIFAIAYGDEKITVNKVTGAKTTARTKQAVKIAWNKVAGATGYRIYLWKNSKWNILAHTASTAYVKTKLAAGTNYTFGVRAYKKYGNEVVWGDNVKVTTFTQTDNAKNLKVAKRTSRAMTITWSKVTGATGYCVYKWNGKKWVNVGKVKTNRFTFTGLSKNKTYSMAVRPYKTSGGVTVMSAKVTSVKGKTLR